MNELPTTQSKIRAQQEIKVCKKKNTKVNSDFVYQFCQKNCITVRFLNTNKCFFLCIRCIQQRSFSCVPILNLNRFLFSPLWTSVHIRFYIIFIFSAFFIYRVSNNRQRSLVEVNVQISARTYSKSSTLLFFCYKCETFECHLV